MRLLVRGEQIKRGCRYCTDVGRGYPHKGSGLRLMCPHRKCPFAVLDKYEDYEDYMKSKDSKIDIAAFIDAAEGVGRVTPSARVNIPVLRRMSKEPLF